MDGNPLRQVDGARIISTSNPKLVIEIDPTFDYVGTLRFPLKGLAFVERVVFAQHSRRITDRLFIAQFEGALPGSDVSYDIPMINPVVLGQHAYHHNVWVYNHAEDVLSNPQAESEHTAIFLQKQDLQLEDNLAMSRFARVTDDTYQHEVILFYLETARIFGLSVAEYEAKSEEERAIADEGLLQRSLNAFDIIA